MNHFKGVSIALTPFLLIRCKRRVPNTHGLAAPAGEINPKASSIALLEYPNR